MVLRRLRDLTTATINEVIDQLENPVVMLKQYMRDMEHEIVKAEETLAKQKTLAQKFQLQADDARKMTAKRAGQAQLALKAGEEELAKQALHGKMHYEEKVKQYEQMQKEAEEQVQAISKQLHDMKERYQLLKDRKHALIARAEAAKAKEKMAAAMDQFDTESIAKGFFRIEERILEMENRTNVRNEDHTFDARAIKLEQHDAVEQELKKMKESMQ